MIRHRFNRTLTVFRPSHADDGAGGRTTTMVEHSMIRAQVSQPSAQERAVAQQMGANLTHVVHASAVDDVQRGDELGGELPTEVEDRLRVVAVMKDSHETYLRIECEVTQSG